MPDDHRGLHCCKNRMPVKHRASAVGRQRQETSRGAADGPCLGPGGLLPKI